MFDQAKDVDWITQAYGFTRPAGVRPAGFEQHGHCAHLRFRGNS
jgi:hypothetical protein